MPSASVCLSFRRKLLPWFAKNQRDLPWRRDRDPYRIWVSEIMLQQTQVATVIPYFQRFLIAFPTLRVLASAQEKELLKLWEGLGYYRRARHLHQAARQLLELHAGRIPDDPAVLQDLPGMGRYTVGAVLSQAFDRRLPILEANSLRVLCRVFGVRSDPRKGPARRRLWQTAEALLPERGSGEFNQALMELGALVCTPASPACSACPLASLCKARRNDWQADIPVKAAPPAIVKIDEVAVVVRRPGRVLLVQRPDSGRWAGLWEFPRGPVQPGENHENAATRLLAELTSLRADQVAEIMTIRYGVTRFRMTMVCFEARYRKGIFRSSFYRQAAWVAANQLGHYALSAPQRRLAKALVDNRCQRQLF